MGSEMCIRDSSNTMANDNKWGEIVEGIQCRVVAVSPDSNDESVDLSKVTNQFADGSDATFAVELKNVSDKPIGLLGTKQNTDISGDLLTSHLFHFDFTDSQGNPLPRARRVLDRQTAPMFMIHMGDVREISPGKSLIVLLRPGQFMAPMGYDLPPQKYNVKVCLLYTSPSPRDATLSRMPSSA